MRKGTKSVMINKLAVFYSNHLHSVTLELVDSNEALYHRQWSKFGTVDAFAKIILHVTWEKSFSDAYFRQVGGEFR